MAVPASPPESHPGAGAALRRIIFAGTALFALWRLSLLVPALDGGEAARAVAVVQALIEIGAAFYLISSLVKALVYHRLVRSSSRIRRTSERRPPVAILYLACDDVDEEALESLARVRYDGELRLIVHDDSGSDEGRAAVDGAVARIRALMRQPVLLLRRPRKEGGKAAVLNWVLARMESEYEFLVLCDNDSVARDPDFIPGALSVFEDPRVAAVQFRNVGRINPEHGRIHRLLARAVDSFDVFVRFYAISGVMPFLGHNAMLRMEALRKVEGFREGLLSDDIDLTVRLALEGLRVEYAPEIEFGELHPASYGAFRRRCQKWSYGCMQVLGRHLFRALRSRRLTAAAKLWLLEFSCFYLVQSFLIVYLVVSYIVAPLVGVAPDSGILSSMVTGLLVVAAILAPTLAYFLSWGQAGRWGEAAWCCALVYGGSAFATVRGTFEYLAGLRKDWIPTNRKMSERRLPAAILAEACFGLLLLGVPLLYQPELIRGPAYDLFVAVFLFAPIVHWTYRGPVVSPAVAPGAPGGEPPGGSRRQAERGRLRRAAGRVGWVGMVAMCVLASLGGLSLYAVEHDKPSRPRVTIRGESLYVDGHLFQVRGIDYSPWLPGTGPGGKYPWPDDKTVAADFDLLQSLNVNTLLVRDAPRSLLDRATRDNLMVIYAFTIDWQSLKDPDAFAARVRAIEGDVRHLEDEPSLMMWSLGNEIPEWIYKQYGSDFLAGKLRELSDAIRKLDPDHPITHQNWPVTKDFEPSFLDVVSFNLYPTWPREVVVHGYGDYIQDVLKPLAGKRPLLITEFGMNTLESSPERQASTLRECWKAISSSTAGGVVFEFSDEWWKNYDNPIAPPDYWHRKFAPDDEKSHDLDPEEYYGIYSTDRRPKPAAQAVREMFAPRGFTVKQAWFLAPLALLLGYTFYVLRRKL